MIAPPFMNSPLQSSWKLQQHEEVTSTNDLARGLPGWHAVLARRQTQGRGRYRRAWVSDEGGLWLSAVLPTPGAAADWSILPLAAGWALRSAIASLGVQDLRLRWPNDLMVGKAKLAGILVERYQPDCAVIGIGINHLNQPDRTAPELAGTVTRLADLLEPVPSREIVLATLLAALAEAQQRIASGRSEDFLPELNEAWSIRHVHVRLSNGAGEFSGEFQGVDGQGNLLVLDQSGTQRRLSPLSVELLREP